MLNVSLELSFKAEKKKKKKKKKMLFSVPKENR